MLTDPGQVEGTLSSGHSVLRVQGSRLRWDLERQAYYPSSWEESVKGRAGSVICPIRHLRKACLGFPGALSDPTGVFKTICLPGTDTVLVTSKCINVHTKAGMVEGVSALRLPTKHFCEHTRIPTCSFTLLLNQHGPKKAGQLL